VLVIWTLDRPGRTVKGLVDFVAKLQERKIQFRSLTDGIDTTTPAGRFFFHVMASLAQMERELLAERTRAGLGAAAGPGRGAQAANDAGEGGVGPQTPERRNGSQRNRSESRRFDPNAVPLVTRVESVNLSSQDEGCRHRGFWQAGSHGGSRR
jgi:hypothetical protein